MADATLDQIGERLRAPFPAKDVKWRIGSVTGKQGSNPQGLALAYLDARAVQRRLDDVLGWAHWRASYVSLNGSGVVCILAVQLPDGSWLEKSDGADPTDVEATKGGISDAFKRAAASGYGIGRYLYDLGNTWVAVEQRGKSYFMKRGEVPQLPASALPAGESQAPAKRRAPRPRPPPSKPAPPADDAGAALSLTDEERAEMVAGLGQEDAMTEAQYAKLWEDWNAHGWKEWSDVPDPDLDLAYHHALDHPKTPPAPPASQPSRAHGEPHAVGADGKPVCPDCGGPMNPRPEDAGTNRPEWKCKQSKYDSDKKKEVGKCSGVIWTWIQKGEEVPVTAPAHSGSVDADDIPPGHLDDDIPF